MKIKNNHLAYPLGYYASKRYFSYEKLILLLLAIDLLIVLTTVKINYEWTTQILILMLAVLTFFKSNWKELMQNKYVVLIFISYSILFIYTLFQHGPSIGMYFYRFSRLLPLLLAGIIVSHRQKWTAVIFLVSLIGVCIGNFPIFLQSSSFVVRTDLLYMDSYLQSPYRYVPAAFVVILSLYLYEYYTNIFQQLMVIALGVMAALIVVKSGFSVSIITLLTGLMIVGVMSAMLNGTINMTRKLGFVLLSLAPVIIIIYGLQQYAPDTIPAQRINSIFELLIGDTSVDLNVTSGTRIDLMKVSWDTFMTYPIFGVGAYALSGSFRVIGSHSSVIDNLGQFGLIGGMLLNFMLISWIIAAAKIFQTDKGSNLGTCLIGLWGSYFMGCIMNPFLFSAAVDHYIFTFAGITIGHVMQLQKYRY